MPCMAQIIERDTYILTVDGLVDNPLAISYDQLLAYPQQSWLMDLNCVEGWNFTAKWIGPELNSIFDAAGVKPEAKIAIFYTADVPAGYTSMDFNYITEKNIIIALKLNDITLPEERGFPFQVVANNKYGYKSYLCTRYLRCFLRKGLITERIIELISSWAHTGFGVYSGKRINPKDKRSTENLAKYIIRASFSQERMKYFPDQAKVTYQSKYGRQVKEFNPLEWMAALVSHIPDRGGQTVRYLGHYSNVTRGRLKKEDGQPEYHIIEDESPGGLNRS